MKRARRALHAILLLLLPLSIFMTTNDGLSQVGPGLPPTTTARDVADDERAFARRSVEVGWREAFLEFFADDAVSYAPDPGHAKERLLKRPPTPRPQKVVLHWWPVYADISRSADMALTTGPSVAYENTPERKVVYNGYYFSVWKVQPDGKWKVAIDIGVETPSPAAADMESAPLRTAPAHAAGWKWLAGDPKAVVSALLDDERKASRKFAGGNVAKHYGALLREEGARLHRAGVLPLVGKTEIAAHLAGKARKLTWQPAAGDVSHRGDFAYTYGAYELTTKDAGVERGHYLHVWRRDTMAPWRLAADVMSPAPPEKK